jgi:hypothetical protein
MATPPRKPKGANAEPPTIRHARLREEVKIPIGIPPLSLGAYKDPELTNRATFLAPGFILNKATDAQLANIRAQHHQNYEEEVLAKRLLPKGINPNEAPKKRRGTKRRRTNPNVHENAGVAPVEGINIRLPRGGSRRRTKRRGTRRSH